MTVRWSSTLDSLTQQPNSTIADWMCKPKHISAAIKRITQQLRLEVADETVKPAFADEYASLALDCQPAWIRQIFIYGDEVPFTYGRVMVPQATYRHYQTEFDTLGTKLLGESLLYARNDVSRSEFEYACIDPSQAMHSDVHQFLDPKHRFGELWGRRSRFTIGGFPLLLTELFLPLLPQYVHER